MLKTGKKWPRRSLRTLAFSDYLGAGAADLPVPPLKVYWEYKIPPASIGMFVNDKLSCCLAAYAAHHLMLITAHTGTMITPEDVDVVELYSKFSGYQPGNPATDTGGFFVDLYRVLMSDGLCGHKIDAYAAIDIHNPIHRRLAVWLFMGAGIGVMLPPSAIPQFEAGQDWNPLAGEVGQDGHAILEPGFGSLGHDYESWGKGDQKGTNAWDSSFVDEAYIILTKDLVSAANDLSPTALNYDQLSAAMKAMAA